MNQYRARHHQHLAAYDYVLAVLLLTQLVTGSSLPTARDTTTKHAGVPVACTDPFVSTTAVDFIASLDPGWNLGNVVTVKNESAWANYTSLSGILDDAQAAGFRSVRVPVAWHQHMFEQQSATWKSDPQWLHRLSDVVDMSISRGLRTIVTIREDSADSTTYTGPGINETSTSNEFYHLWLQIGTTLACKSELLALEPISKPQNVTIPFPGEHVTRLNDLFLRAINLAGGNNAKRVVTLLDQKVNTTNGNYSNPTAVKFEYWSPYDFVSSAWGKTIWGSDSDKAALENDFATMRKRYPRLPLVISEWSCPVVAENAARWKYVDFLIRTAKKYNISTIAWDNGSELLDRPSHTWRDNVELSIIMNAQQGLSNSLPDSTEDNSITQVSSAYIFHQAGTNVTLQDLPILQQGNILENIIWQDRTLLIDSEFVFSPNNIRFQAGLLSAVFNNDTTPGVKANFTVTFNEGAHLLIQAVKWSLPSLKYHTIRLASKEELRIPITWSGLPKLAAVRAIKSDGSFLFDEWTKTLPPLQQGRLVYSDHFTWSSSEIVLTSSFISAVRSARQNISIMLEFFPRSQGNALNLTLLA